MTDSREVTVDFGGRPQKYTKPDDLADKVARYFDELGDDGIPGLADLALYLGFASRQSMYDLENRKGFGHIIQRARLAIERYHENLIFQTRDPKYSIDWLR